MPEAIFSSLFNFATNIGLSAYNNNAAAEREAQARKENYKYNEMSAMAADQRTRALYRDLMSPNALLQQYKEAGLSPSLIFGGGGIGGQTSQGAQGAGAAGIAPQTYGVNPVDIAAIRLANSEADKNKAEADRINGENERGKAEIAQILENTKNIGLKNAWQEYENSLKMLQVSYEASTFEKKVANFFKETEYLEYKVRSAAVAAEIDEQSQTDVLSYLHERVINVMADTLLKRSEKQFNEAKIDLTNEQIADLISQIVTREGTLKLSEEQLEKQVEQWGKENNLTSRAQNIAIAKAIMDFQSAGMDRGADLLKSLIPWNKTTKVKGL